MTQVISAVLAIWAWGKANYGTLSLIATALGLIAAGDSTGYNKLLQATLTLIFGGALAYRSHQATAALAKAQKVENKLATLQAVAAVNDKKI